jgi:hypothetical protein
MGYLSTSALLRPFILLSNLGLLLLREIIDDSELKTNLFRWFAYVITVLPLIMVATLAQQS